MATKKKPASKSAEVATIETAQVVEKVAKIKKVDVIQGFSDLTVQVQEALAGLSSSIADGLRQRDEVALAVEAAKLRLQELYDIEPELLSLAEVNRQREEAEALAEQEAEAREAARVKESDEFVYNLNRKRREEQDRHADSLAAQKKADAAQRAQREAELSDREAIVEARETKVDELEARVAAFPAELDAAVKKAEAVLGNVLRKQHEHERALASKDAESKERVASQEIANLKAQLADAKALANAMRDALAEAHEKAHDIATEAVKAGSGQAALAALQTSQAAQSVANKAGR